eukprot:7376637-Prymnesium_polylepis.1
MGWAPRPSLLRAPHIARQSPGVAFPVLGVGPRLARATPFECGRRQRRCTAPHDRHDREGDRN